MGKVAVQVKYENGQTGWIYADYKDNKADGKIDATEQKRALDAAQKYIKDHKISGTTFAVSKDADKINVLAIDNNEAQFQHITASEGWKSSVTKLFGTPIPKDELTSLDGPPLTQSDVDALQKIVDDSSATTEAKAKARLLICIYKAKDLKPEECGKFFAEIQRIMKDNNITFEGAKTSDGKNFSVIEEATRVQWENGVDNNGKSGAKIELPKGKDGILVAGSFKFDAQVARALRRCPNPKMGNQLAEFFKIFSGAIRLSSDAGYIKKHIEKNIVEAGLHSDKDFDDKTVLTPMKIGFLTKILNKGYKDNGWGIELSTAATYRVVQDYTNLVIFFGAAKEAKPS